MSNAEHQSCATCGVGFWTPSNAPKTTCLQCRLKESAARIGALRATPSEPQAHLTCGHCFAPMTYEAVGLRCSKKCRKAWRRNVRQWRTMAGRVVNVRHMEDSHLINAIRYLEREHRTTVTGYGWLREEQARRGIVYEHIHEALSVAPAPVAAPVEIGDDEDIVPPKRGIRLKGVL